MAQVTGRDMEKLERVAKYAFNTKGFAQYYLGETFYDEPTHQHNEVWDALDDESLPWVGRFCWRGFGKTSSLKAKVIKSICYRNYPYIMYLGKTFDYASGITEDIKSELLTNDKIREDFGMMKAVAHEGHDLTFSKKGWFCSDPETGMPFAYVVPKGVGNPVRGSQVKIGFRTYRPSIIVIDDFEDDEEVANEMLRDKYKKWFYGALLNCVNTRRHPDPKTNRWLLTKLQPYPEFRVFYIDTVKHEAALAMDILQDSQWNTKVHPLAYLGEDKKYHSFVPELVPTSVIQADIARAKEKGRFDEYCLEKLCTPQAPDSAAWNDECYNYYSESMKPINTSPGFDRFVICDPAKTVNSGSAYTAGLAVGADCSEGHIYIRKLINERIPIEQLAGRIFDLCIETNSKVLAVEITGIEDYLKYLFTTYRNQRGLHQIRFIWLKSRSAIQGGEYGHGREAAKKARASMILPYYKNKQVFHETCIKDSALEKQQRVYPRNRLWDALDTCGYIPKVLEELGRFFAAKVVDKTPDYWSNPIEWDKMTQMIQRGDWEII